MLKMDRHRKSGESCEFFGEGQPPLFARLHFFLIRKIRRIRGAFDFFTPLASLCGLCDFAVDAMIFAAAALARGQDLRIAKRIFRT